MSELTREEVLIMQALSAPPGANYECHNHANGAASHCPGCCDEKLARLQQEREAQTVRTKELERAMRTRPDYDLRCGRCGAPHNLDTSIPSEIWNTICPDRVDVLCTLCIDERLAEAGLSCEAEFYFSGNALHGKPYTQQQLAEATSMMENLRLDAMVDVQRMQQAAEIIESQTVAIAEMNSSIDLAARGIVRLTNEKSEMQAQLAEAQAEIVRLNHRVHELVEEP